MIKIPYKYCDIKIIYWHDNNLEIEYYEYNIKDYMYNYVYYIISHLNYTLIGNVIGKDKAQIKNPWNFPKEQRYIW